MKDLLIIDLEATCYDTGREPPGFVAEIIEIGAVLLDAATRTVTGEYQAFVKPVRFPTLSVFCTRLTSIQQSEVDGGVALGDALAGLVARLYDPQRVVFASWGFYDQKQIAAECARRGLAYPFEPEHISLKHEYAAFYHLNRPLGMAAALKMHGLALAGIHHRGRDDARNIAQIAVRMLADGWSG